jgi:phospholipid/cholesterol/gamma-HCH transport system ATP-binding protein
VSVAVSVEDIHHGFEGSPVLDGISFEVREGEVLGIVGPGGVGKTVLLKIMAALLRPDRGQVHVFGEDIHTLGAGRLAAVRRRMGMLFQNYALFDFLPVVENVAFPLLRQGDLPREKVISLASSLLAEVGLAGTESLYPSELSGGMKKRVALARATIHAPDLVLYDDPTAGLDPVTSSKIFGLLRRLHDERWSTDVVVSHDVDRMKDVCDRYLVLHDGRVQFRGTIEEAESASEDPVVKVFFFASDKALPLAKPEACPSPEQAGEDEAPP